MTRALTAGSQPALSASPQSPPPDALFLFLSLPPFFPSSWLPGLFVLLHLSGSDEPNMADRETLEPPDNSNGSNVASPRSSTDSRSPSLRNHSRHRSFASNHRHRQSFSESLRGAPGSPRAHRPPSLTQSAIQSLIDNPPARNHANPAFAGRDWRHISVGDLVSPDDLKFVDLDTGIEEATNVPKWCA